MNSLFFFLGLAALAGSPYLMVWLLQPILGLTSTGTIMVATTKEMVRQPAFILLILIVFAINGLNTIVPFFTLGDDVKMLKDCGLATILIAGLVLTVYTCSTSIADEIEGKTAMTLLSKPINRWQFILGKYFGILVGLLLMIMPMAIWFLLCIYYKVPYDAKESSAEVTQMDTWISIYRVLPGLVLIYFEIAVMAAISVAISTRMPMVVNMTTCLAIFVVGHLTPNLVNAGVFKLEVVEFMARLFATILPALENYNIQAAIATDAIVPPTYLWYSLLYTFCYASMAILAAFILFEDRDLA